MFVYLKSEPGLPGLWTVGHYSSDGTWMPESDHKDATAAAARVHYLNGGAYADLLVACKELCRRLEANELVNRPSNPCNHYDQPTYDRARAAIAKATGGGDAVLEVKGL
jgi:hypothetical protein